MSTTSEKYARWSLLDKLLAEGTPKSQIEILENYQKNDPNPKKNIGDYGSTFRNDMQLLKSALKKHNLSGMLLVGKGAEDKQWDTGKDNRTKTFCYREQTFSIMPYMTNEMTDSEYRTIVKAVEKLRGKISEQIFEEIQFAIQSRIEADYDKGNKCVVYEDNRHLKGRQYRPALYRAIIKKEILTIKYKTFSGQEIEYTDLHPYLLKQYNERWYLLGLSHDNPYIIIPLDRIDSNPISSGTYPESCPENYESYFDNIVGVTKKSTNAEIIKIGIHDINAWGHIITKPLPTQHISIEYDKNRNYGQITLELIPNEELYTKILSWGKYIEIESPQNIKENFINIISSMLHNVYISAKKFTT